MNSKRHQNWIEKYDITKEYIQEYGTMPSYNTVYKDVNIGSFIRIQQKKMYNQPTDRLSNLEEWQIEKLKLLGIELKPTSIKITPLRKLLNENGYENSSSWEELADICGITIDVFKKYVYGSREILSAKAIITILLLKALGNPPNAIDILTNNNF